MQPFELPKIIATEPRGEPQILRVVRGNTRQLAVPAGPASNEGGAAVVAG